MSKIHRIAGLKISRVETSIGMFEEAAQGRDLLPDLEPADERLRRDRTRIFSRESIHLSHDSAVDDVFDPALRAEHSDVVARMTVYVINLIVIVFALPVGLALLCLNILGGENLRTTAHILALTGLYMALASNQGSTQLFWMI